MQIQTTLDGLLNRRIRIEQPREGYRIAVDTLLLAAAVPAVSGQSVVDLGCGVGGAMIALAYRVPGLRVTGIDVQPELVRLCAANIERNGMQDRAKVFPGDAILLPPEMMGAFDHVMMNPPYHDEAHHDASAHKGKKRANTENEGDLRLWVQNAFQALKKGGILTLIHRADRLEEIRGYVGEGFGLARIKPIVTKPDAGPKRIIVRAEKGAVGACVVSQPLMLHEPSGKYTAEAEAILRDAGAVDFS